MAQQFKILKIHKLIILTKLLMCLRKYHLVIEWHLISFAAVLHFLVCSCFCKKIFQSQFFAGKHGFDIQNVIYK